jgi:fructose-1,6-bisphosphatase II
VREAGARIKFISDGDVAGAIMAAREGTGVDLLLGIGGTPEGDHRGLRDQVPRRRHPGQALAADDAERQRAIDAGHDLDRVLPPTTS